MSQERKPGVDVRALVRRLNKESRDLLQRDIIAPLLPGGKIRTRLSGLVYEFKPKTRFTGWGHFRPCNEGEAELVAEALPWERGGYLELFPALRVILLWPEPDPRRPGTWWALPFNESDAKQRFGFSADPLPVFLCDPMNGAERFERVIARVDGQTLWFEGPDTLADPTHAEWLRDTAATAEQTTALLSGLASSERLALLFWQLRQFEQAAIAEQGLLSKSVRQIQEQSRGQQLAWLRRGTARLTLEARLRHALEKADAVLHSYSEIANPDGSLGHLTVEWSEQGNRRRYRSLLDPDLTVVSSGICLSDRDRDFDLTSLVNVMSDSPFE
ncbi:hypothetical protein EPA93_44615 [Ktedonosporobacter rubrisoli]|uniref:Uncharacterized protein n=1 Tax=Ktedonosporobacter rubrisoli TaxID=2509675 RepID=A0A4P6K3C4_KTERU|nr:hypothetical protein [Ktedonosporobacter rubrisoli]QBD82679.1 hypothetical protein EPA93_44615 [Ktedonosporobacter rubrisoli]